MRIKTPLILAALAAAAYFTFRQFSGLTKTYTVRLGGIRFNNNASRSTLYTKAIFDVSLLLNNPTQFSGTVTGVKLDILLGSRVLATINKTDRLSIQASGQTIIPIQVGINTLTIYGNVSEAIRQLSGGQPLTFTVVGTVLTNYGQIPVNETVRTN